MHFEQLVQDGEEIIRYNAILWLGIGSGRILDGEKESINFALASNAPSPEGFDHGLSNGSSVIDIDANKEQSGEKEGEQILEERIKEIGEIREREGSWTGSSFRCETALNEFEILWRDGVFCKSSKSSSS